MWTPIDIAWAVFWLCIIALSPATYRFWRVFFRYVFNKYISNEDVIVIQKINGAIVSKYKISKYHDGRITYTKLSLEDGAPEHE